MPDTPTPGETAYTAYWPCLHRNGATWVPVAWEQLSPVVRDAWEAAAQAVLKDCALQLTKVWARASGINRQEEEPHG